jgi:competence protein ComEC
VAANLHAADVMWKTIFVITTSILLLDSYLLNILAPKILYLHNICQDSVPRNSAYFDMYAAIVCASNLKKDIFSQNIRDIGLFHLIIVSGSHFVFLEQLLIWISKKFGGLSKLKLHQGTPQYQQKSRRISYFKTKCAPIVVFLILSLFALTCKLAPPVTRSWVSLMLRNVNEESKLCWQGYHTTFFSGVVSLLIYPQWFTSISFQLSWMAAFMISLPIEDSLRRHFLIYCGLLPIMSTIQFQHPLTSAINWIFAPLVGLALFPLSLFTLIFNFISPITDKAWWAFEKLCQFLAGILPTADTPPTAISMAFLWVYLLLCHLAFFYIFRYRARKSVA